MIDTRGIAKQKLETVGTLKQINEWSEAILLSKDNTLIHNRFRNSTSEKTRRNEYVFR